MVANSSHYLIKLDFFSFLKSAFKKVFFQINQFLGKGLPPLSKKLITLKFISLAKLHPKHVETRVKRRPYKFHYGVCLFFCFLALIGCSGQISRRWEFNEIEARASCFNGGRLRLGPDCDISHLELEIIRNSSGIYFYINLLLLHAPPWKEDPLRTTLTIQFNDMEPWIIHPYLLEGGQRILLPNDVADTLVQSLLQENSFVIQIGRSQINVISADFINVYQHLLNIPIEDEVSDNPILGKPQPWLRLKKVMNRIKLVPSF